MLLALNLENDVHFNLKAFALSTTPLICNNDNCHSSNGDKTLKIRVATGKAEKFFLLRALISIIYVTTVTTQLVLATALDGISVRVFVESLLYSVVIASHLPIVFKHYSERHQIVSLYNALFQFERKYNPHNWTSPEQSFKQMTLFIKLFLLLCVGAEYGIPVMMWLFQVFVPCFPASLGYFLHAPCVHPGEPWTLFPGYFLRIAFATFTSWTIAQSLGSVALEASTWTALHCFCFVGYLKILKRSIAEEGKSCLKMFKEIQILIVHYNIIHGGVLAFTLLYIVTSVFIMGLYVIVGLNQEFALPQLLLYGYLTLGTGLNIVFCDGTLKSSVLLVSSNVLQTAKQSLGIMRNPIKRRQLMSLPVLKIMLGKVNFYDKQTPVTVLDFAITLVVNLLLI